MNSIPADQNHPANLDRLAAQRQLYAEAKIVFGWQLVVGVPLTIAFFLVAAVWPNLRPLAAMWGLVASIADISLLNPWQKRLKESAALIQEAFDTDVLKLPWNDLKAGNRPDREVIKQRSDRYAKHAAKYPPLENWYPIAVGELPMVLARVVCQRANCWWDSAQRKRYATWAAGSLAVLYTLIGVIGFVGGMTVEKLFLGIVVPLAPATIVGIRQWTEQLEAVKRLDRLKEHSDLLWRQASDRLSASKLAGRSRNLQDEILENRKRSPLVFDFIFRKLRKEYELQMNYSADELVREAKGFRISDEL